MHMYYSVMYFAMSFNVTLGLCVRMTNRSERREHDPPIHTSTIPKSAVKGKVKPPRQWLSGLLSSLLDVGGWYVLNLCFSLTFPSSVLRVHIEHLGAGGRGEYAFTVAIVLKQTLNE